MSEFMDLDVSEELLDQVWVDHATQEVHLPDEIESVINAHLAVDPDVVRRRAEAHFPRLQERHYRSLAAMPCRDVVFDVIEGIESDGNA